jgi:tripartite-type tricarboxylate transporter receptor subunit TctC
MVNRRKLTFVLVLFTAVAVNIPSGSAQVAYPTKFIKVIIPNPPGGPGDVIARAFGDSAARSIGQPFVFEYRAGASTIVGTQAVVRADPDGYTILGFPSSGLAVSVLRKDLPYNLETDLKPVIGIGSIPMALVVRADSKFKSIEDLSNAAKTGDIIYASAGVGTLGHLTGTRFLNELKGTGTHVPFRGNPDALQEVMGGRIDFFFASIADAAQAASTNRIRVLGVTANERVSDLPDTPTMGELGFANFTPKLWYAFLAPGKTPDDLVMRLYSAFAEAAKDPTVQKRLSTVGFTVEIRNPQDLATMMREEATRWKKVIEYNNITLE